MKVPEWFCPSGRVHDPLDMGEPPSRLKSRKSAALSQTVMDAFVPALGAMFTLTVTKPVSFAQGAVPATTYAYVPAVLVPGVNVPEVDASDGSSQAPDPLGDPPNWPMSANGPLVLHTAKLPFVPALGAIVRVTCTTALKLVQGVVPTTV